MEIDTTSRSLSEKIVLLSLTRLEEGDAAPAQTHEVSRTTRSLVETADVDTVGMPTEADVSRALNQLEADDYVEAIKADSSSPAGKGRPAYTLTVEPTSVLNQLADDETVGRLADHVADGQRSE